METSQTTQIHFLVWVEVSPSTMQISTMRTVLVVMDIPMTVIVSLAKFISFFLIDFQGTFTDSPFISKLNAF